MSRNEVLRSVFVARSMMRMRPAFSRTKRRVESPGADTMHVGYVRPVAMMRLVSRAVWAAADAATARAATAAMVVDAFMGLRSRSSLSRVVRASKPVGRRANNTRRGHAQVCRCANMFSDTARASQVLPKGGFVPPSHARNSCSGLQRHRFRDFVPRTGPARPQRDPSGAGGPSALVMDCTTARAVSMPRSRRSNTPWYRATAPRTRAMSPASTASVRSGSMVAA